MKMFLALMAAAALVLAASCSKDDEGEKELSGTMAFTGTVSVTLGVSVNKTPDSRVSVTFSKDGKEAQLDFYGIQFVPAMPPMDISIPSLLVEEKEGDILLKGDEIVPLALGGEYPKYTVYDFIGRIDSNKELVFSLLFGTTPTSFEGVYSKD